MACKRSAVRARLAPPVQRGYSNIGIPDFEHWVALPGVGGCDMPPAGQEILSPAAEAVGH